MKKIIVFVMIVMTVTSFWGCETKETQEEPQEQYIYAFDGQAFDSASDFDCGYALVKSNDRTYFMDIDGNEVYVLPSEEEYKVKYGDRGSFHASISTYLGQGLCNVYLADDCGNLIYDTKGNVVEIKGRDSNDPRSSTFPFVIQGEMIYWLQNAGEGGNMLGDPYENTIFKGRFLWRLDHPKFAYSDDNGKLVFPSYLDFENSNKPIYLEGGGYLVGDYNPYSYLIDSQGKYILNPDGSKFTLNDNEGKGSKDNMYCFETGVTKIDDNGIEKYLNDKGEFIDEDGYNLFYNLSEGYSVSYDDEGGLFGYKDSSGKVVVDPKFDVAGSVHNGLACVKEGESFYYIIIGTPKIDKVELKKGIILLDPTIATGVSESSHKQTDTPTNDKMTAIEFIGKTYTEVESMIGAKLEFYSEGEGGASYFYGDLDSEYFTFSFPYNGFSNEVDKNSKAVYIDAIGGAYIDGEVSTNMSIQEIESIKGIKLDIRYYDGEASGNYGTLKLDNGYEVTLMADDNLEKIISAEICTKEY